MKSIITTIAIMSCTLSAFALDIQEYKGKLVTNYQSLLEPSYIGFQTLGVALENGAVVEVAVPEHENLRLLKRHSGKEVIFETGMLEGMQIPMALNMAVLFKDTQVTYWESSTEDYYSFPQENATDETETDNITGIVRFDEKTISEKASGFIIVDRDETYKVANDSRDMMYTLRGLRGQLANFTVKLLSKKEEPVVPPINIEPFDFHEMNNPMFRNHMNGWGNFLPFSSSASNIPHWKQSFTTYRGGGASRNMSPTVNPIIDDAITEPVDSDDDNEENEDENLIEIQAFIKPMQLGSIQGKASISWNNGQRVLELEVSDDNKVNLLFDNEFYTKFTDASLGSSILKVKYRIVHLQNGAQPMVESYEVIQASEFEDTEVFPGP